MKFYFTYGTDGYPYVGGWTEVDAPDGHAACAAFRAYHPDKIEGLLNCASVYNEDDFQQTEMCQDGNFGSQCHEVICLEHYVQDADELREIKTPPPVAANE